MNKLLAKSLVSKTVESYKYQDCAEYYRELTIRNKHFISPVIQKKLNSLTILIAGCGSTGGACIESLARLGVGGFILADNGAYELNNLNRQHATTLNIGTNKAEYHAEQVILINPFANVRFYTEGITDKNLVELTKDADVVFDAVDVTNQDSMKLKIKLHFTAKQLKKPVFTALDLGFKQYGLGFDYRNSSVSVLGGKWKKATEATNPLNALFSFFPLGCIPDHCLPLFHDLLRGKDTAASQLGCASDMLSAIIVPTIVRFVEKNEVIKSWDYDLYHLLAPYHVRLVNRIKSLPLRRQIYKALRTP